MIAVSCLFGATRWRASLALAAAFSAALGDFGFATSTTTTFQPQITIQATCTIIGASALNFGTQGVLASNIDQTSTVTVTY